MNFNQFLEFNQFLVSF